MFFKHKYQFWKKRRIPTVTTHTIFGTMKDCILLKTTIGEELNVRYKHFKAQGYKYFGGYIFYQPFLVTIDPDFSKNVTTKDFNYFVDHGGYSNEEADPLTTNLFLLSGSKWKNLRHKLTPTFSSGKLKMMFQTLVSCSEELKECLDEYVAQNKPINIQTVLAQFTIDVIGSCAFGLECNSFKNPDSEFIIQGKNAFNLRGLDRLKFLFSNLFPYLSKLLKVRVTNKKVDHFFRNLVKDTIEFRENNNIVRKDFMHLLIQLKNKGVLEDEEADPRSDIKETKPSINEICGQAFIFFLAGYETSSTTMTFALHELAENMQIQEKVRQEIINVLVEHNGNLTYDAIKDMHYLNRVVLGNNNI